jgi:LacI family transcriptional regulator
MQRVTLHDIAKKAGVSVATVSLALRGRGELSQKRTEDIRALAKEMGYRPNPMLAALASKRFSSSKSQQGTPIAIFEFPPVPTLPKKGKPGLYHKSLVEEALRLGYAPTHFMLTPDSPIASLYRQLYSRSTQGIIITGNLDMDSFGQGFDWEQFTVVQCARFRNDNPFHTVRPNIFQSIKLAFTEVRKRGYQRIGFALGRHVVLLEDDEDRHGTALALEMAYLQKKDRLPPYLGSFDDRPAFIKWYQAHRPDVVLGFTVSHYWALREAGIRMPEDVGFTLLQQAEHNENISGLIQNNDAIGRQSVQLLDQLIRNHERGPTSLPMHTLIPSTWHEGTTLRPVVS